MPRFSNTTPAASARRDATDHPDADVREAAAAYTAALDAYHAAPVDSCHEEYMEEQRCKDDYEDAVAAAE